MSTPRGPLRALRHRWEAASNSWNQWVIGYNSSIQRDLLARLGLGRSDWAALGGAMGGALAVFIVGLWLWAMRQRRTLDPLARNWARFSAQLAARGLGRDPWEGPLAYGERLAAHYSTMLAEPATAPGTTERVARGSLTVRAPLVAGRVEEAIVSGLREFAVAEAELLSTWSG